VNLVITIDTEEDDWSTYRREGSGLRNIERVPALQRLFDEFRVRPTYLIDYPVATEPRTSALFRELAKDGRCEIGAHCHPWNTPPFREEISVRNTMLCNLDPGIQYEKVRALHQAISENVDVVPTCFRAGRWGFGAEVAGAIARLGYRIDTSVTPYTDWTRYGGPDFSEESPGMKRIGGDGADSPGGRGGLLEVPPTIGFLQSDFRRSNRLYRRIAGTAWKKTRILGVLDRLKLLNKVWLSPENSGTGEMIGLTRAMAGNGYPVVNLTFHSPSLVEGLTPFVRGAGGAEKFLRKIREYLSFARSEGIQSVVLSEAAGPPVAGAHGAT
jgi:hypothetical protein